MYSAIFSSLITLSNASYLCVVTTGGDLFILSTGDGNVLTSVRLAGEVYSSPIVIPAVDNNDETIVFGGRDDCLHGYSVKYTPLLL